MQQIALALLTTLIQSSATEIAESGASCTVENRPAQIVHEVQADYPELLRQYNLVGNTVVQVRLSDSGKLIAASVKDSSGNRSFDLAAMRAARLMTYAPELRSCKAVAGSYAINVTFDGN